MDENVYNFLKMKMDFSYGQELCFIADFMKNFLTRKKNDLLLVKLVHCFKISDPRLEKISQHFFWYLTIFGPI